MPQGRFITVEGIEGVGKSTHCGYLKALLEARGHSVVLTREPGGTALGDAIRGILLDPALPGMSHLAELLLLFAARAEHLERVIEPALAGGQWVVSDRYTDATYAYQGSGRGIAHADIAALEWLVQRGRTPDLTFLLDAPVEVAMARTLARGKVDRFESERSEFFERVRAGYLAAARQAPERILVIDAALSLDGVQQAIASALARALA